MSICGDLKSGQADLFSDDNKLSPRLGLGSPDGQAAESLDR